MSQRRITYCDGAIFDMDGVITRTAHVHFSAWKETFDGFLRQQSPAYAPFMHADYLASVDGRPRYEGVSEFLRSRGITLPHGDAQDAPECATICGLGNQKNQLFGKVLEEDGVDVFASTLNFIEELLRAGIRIGVATSSKSGAHVLRLAGISSRFSVCIDGNFVAQNGLRGKPHSDIFTVAAQAMRVKAERTMIVEDSAAGVEAGACGGFGLVIGIARDCRPELLRQRGADIVVGDLAELRYAEIEELFARKAAGRTPSASSDVGTS